MKPARKGRFARRTGSAVCTRCGSMHHGMPLEYLDEFMCNLPIPGTEIPGKRKGIPCGGSLEPKRQSPNDQGQVPPKAVT